MAMIFKEWCTHFRADVSLSLVRVYLHCILQIYDKHMSFTMNVNENYISCTVGEIGQII